MKILFTRHVRNGAGRLNGVDYLGDSLFHGFCNLSDCEVIDSPRKWYMYKDSVEEKNEFGRIHGNGFTLYGNLDGRKTYSNEEIIEKIKNNYFDFIVFDRVDFGSPYLDLGLNCYPKNKLIFLDGQDSTEINNSFFGKGWYFKRELIVGDKNIHPISFGFPKEKIQSSLDKTKIFSIVEPSEPYGNHVYTNEQEYYNDYRSSFFGKTKKRGGWDCLRHWEIMGCRCVPFFSDILQMPSRCCVNLPKDLLIKAINLKSTKSDEWFFSTEGRSVYDELEFQIHSHFLKNGTTESLAKYLLEVVSS